MVTQTKLGKKISNAYVQPSSMSKSEWGKINRSVAQYPIGIVVALLGNAAPSRSMFLRNVLNFDNFDIKDLQTLNKYANEAVHHSWCDRRDSGGPHVVYDASVWINSAVLQLKPDFPGRTKHHYELNINLVDYKERNIKNEVNQIVQKKTSNIVKNLLPEKGADISHSTIVFESCFYFDGCWNQKFETRTGTFKPLYNQPVTAQFLTTKNKQYIREGFYMYQNQKKHFQVLNLPYKFGNESRFSMLVLLPNERDYPNSRDDALPNLMNALAETEHTFLDDHFPKEAVEVGDFLLPTFRMGEADETDKFVGLFACPPYDLTGMVKPADSTKNVSINPRRNNSSVAFSRCYMEINQHGTKLAGANATLVQETPTASLKPGKPKAGFARMPPGSGGPLQMYGSGKGKTNFVADHPFVFFIRENAHRVVGSTGIVVNPNLPPQQI